MSDTELLPKSKAEPVRRLEVFTGTGRRRTWTAEQKARLLRDITLADAQRRSADRRDRSRDRWRDPPDRWDRRRSSRWRAYARAYDPESGRPDGVGSNRAAESPLCGEGSGAPVARSSSRRCRPTRNITSPNPSSTVRFVK